MTLHVEATLAHVSYGLLCFQVFLFFFPPTLGGGLQDDCFLFVCVCPWKAWDLIWLLRICFCYLAGIVGGCVNEDPSVYKEMDIQYKNNLLVKDSSCLQNMFES